MTFFFFFESLSYPTGRVFLHPSSILFKSANNLKAGFLTYFSRSVTSAAVDTKVFLRDATEVRPLKNLSSFKRSDQADGFNMD